MRIRITNVLLMPGVTNEAHIPFIPDAEVLVDGSRIAYAGPRCEAPSFEADEVIDGEGMLAMPGLCNMHTHTPMTLLRSIGSDLTLDRWLNEAIFPVEKHLTDEAVRAGSDLGIMEMLRFGTTSFNDMYMHMDMEAEAVRDSGMRALLGHGVVDFDESCADLAPNIALIEKWNHAADDRIRVSLAPHSEGATTEKLLLKVREAAETYHVPIHIHVSETKLDFDGSLQRRGLTPPQYLEKLGLMEHSVLAAHCVWVTDEDIELLARRGVTVLHNPISNLKLASGIAQVEKLRKKGIRVAIGTDSAASNNALDMLEEMRAAALTAKGVSLDPCALSAPEALSMATREGALSQGRADCGDIKVGFRADIVALRMDTIAMTPAHSPLSNLLYAAGRGNVAMTMVDGRILYRDGAFSTIDIERVRYEAGKRALDIARR